MHEKLRLATVRPPFAWFERRKPSIGTKTPPHQLFIIIENRNAASAAWPAHSPENTGSGGGGVVGYKGSTDPPVLLTLPLPSSLPPLPPSITHIFVTQAHFLTSNGEERFQEEGRTDGQGMEEVPQHSQVPR